MSLKRMVIVYEVLYDDETIPDHFLDSIDNISYQTSEGNASGMMLASNVQIVDREAMRGLLIAQLSDPEFLLGDEE
jgi:hypothetical protein